MKPVRYIFHTMFLHDATCFEFTAILRDDVNTVVRWQVAVLVR